MASADRPAATGALAHLQDAIRILASDPAPIRHRLQAAEPHIGQAFDYEMTTRAERHLKLRIASHLVEGGEDGDSGTVADSIAQLDESRAAGIAEDVLRLYELLAGLRSGDGYGYD